MYTDGVTMLPVMYLLTFFIAPMTLGASQQPDPIIHTKTVTDEANEPAQVFRAAIDQIRGQTQIQVLLPSKLPATVRERDIKLAWGTVLENGYDISLYYTKLGSNAGFAAAFAGSTQVFRDLPNTRMVALANGLLGMFRPVSCGGSCAPANLWWEHNGVMYQIQIRLSSSMNEKDQERILVEVANSTVRVRNH